MTAALVDRRGLGKRYRPPLGAARLHPGDPGRPGHRAGRAERRRQEHPAQPGRRAAAPDDGHHRGLRRPAGSRRRPAGQGRLRRPGHPDVRRAQRRATTCGSAPTSTRGGTTRWRRSRVERLGLDPGQRAGRLSGGQRAQLALALGLAKRPELLILDEPVASLDPFARREFLQLLMEAVAEQELSVRALLARRVRPRTGLRPRRGARRLPGAARGRGRDAARHPPPAHRAPPRPGHAAGATSRSSSARHTDRQSTLVVRTERPILDPAWTVTELGLEDLVLSYMERRPTAGLRPEPDGRRPGGAASDLADLAPVPGAGR